ncbi:MAG: Flp family type IVb pilin [Pseudomonadota bacterium]
MIATQRNGTAILRGILARWRAFCKATEGATAIEYALIAGLLVVVIVVALVQVRTSLLNLPFPALIAAFGEALL